VSWTARPDDGARMQSVAGHEEIAAAVFAQDPRRAERAMAEHFDHSVKALLMAGV
jgi:DNA-binding FadR family transcriptional regulator